MTPKPAEPSLALNTSKCNTALLIIDMISDWRFPDAEQLLPRAAAIAAPIAALKFRCRELGLPVVYANDNYGRWRSDFRQVVESSLAGRGAGITRTLMPDHEDYFLLKPKHSAFFCTPLELLLRDLGVERLVLTGVTTDQCIGVTAADARMRDYNVEVPADCIATLTDDRDARALIHYAQVLCVPTTDSAQIELRRDQSGAGALRRGAAG